MVLMNIAHATGFLELEPKPVVKNPFEKVEQEDEDDNDSVVESFAVKSPFATVTGIIFQLINMLIWIFAIYLCFKRNQGFELGSFLAAFCCPICYIVYALAVPVVGY